MARGPDPEIDELAILREFIVSPEPAFVVQEIADELDVTAEGARHQMSQLVERGLLKRKKPGERTVLYWVTDAGQRYYAERADSS